MDATTQRLVDFAQETRFDTLSAQTVHACKLRLIDTFASAMGAYDDPLSRMARGLARKQGRGTASIWGAKLKTTAEAAAFANGVMLRFLDISDTYLGKSRGHPSDVVSGILAVAQELRADGRSVIEAVTLAYDVYCGCVDSIDIIAQGWDQPVFGVVASVLGIGRVMGLSREQMGNAVSLALAPNMALVQTRRGELSAWKGCAGANAARNAVFAAMLAQEGFTGPAEVFEGEGGLWNIVGQFEWQLPRSPGAGHLIEQTHLKTLPICYHGQSAVFAALELRPRVRIDDIGEIQVETYRAAVHMMGNDASRWAPTNRETADHSMPYVIAAAFMDGEVNSQSFEPGRLADPDLAKLMRKVKVSESTELTSQYPEAAPSRLTVRTASGDVLTSEIKYPRGHAKSPLPEREVEQKFRDLFGSLGSAKECDAALRALWEIDRARDIGSEVIERFSLRPESDEEKRVAAQPAGVPA